MADKLAMKDVKPVIFDKSDVSVDGEMIVFTVRGKGGGIGHIAINWHDLSFTAQLMARAAEDAAKVRKSLGKSDDFDGTHLSAQLVSGFQVSEMRERKLKILSLRSPTGFRCDFAIPIDTVDQRGRHFPRAIAEELLGSQDDGRQRPH